MTRLLSIAAVMVALVALCAPSLSLGMGVHASAPVWSDAPGEEMTVSPPGGCKSLGGKRVLPCHPDLGVLAGLLPVTAPPAGHGVWRDVVVPLRAAMPEAELPPPRGG